MNLSLKTKILASGKSQISLARDIEVSEPQLSKIVRGWADPPVEVKNRIARALGCSVSEVFPSPGEHAGKAGGPNGTSAG